MQDDLFCEKCGNLYKQKCQKCKKDNKNIPKSKCLDCGKELSIKNMKRHRKKCKSINTGELIEKTKNNGDDDEMPPNDTESKKGEDEIEEITVDKMKEITVDEM